MMKTKLFTLVFAVLVLGACKKEIKLDVKQIHLTDTTGQWDIKIDRPAFSTKLKKAVSNSTTRSTG